MRLSVRSNSLTSANGWLNSGDAELTSTGLDNAPTFRAKEEDFDAAAVAAAVTEFWGCPIWEKS